MRAPMARHRVAGIGLDGTSHLTENTVNDSVCVEDATCPKDGTAIGGRPDSSMSAA